MGQGFLKARRRREPREITSRSAKTTASQKPIHSPILHIGGQMSARGKCGQWRFFPSNLLQENKPRRKVVQNRCWENQLLLSAVNIKKDVGGHSSGRSPLAILNATHFLVIWSWLTFKTEIALWLLIGRKHLTEERLTCQPTLYVFFGIIELVMDINKIYGTWEKLAIYLKPLESLTLQTPLQPL